MPSLQQMKEQTKTADIEVVNGIIIKTTFYPLRFTPRLEEDAKEAITKSSNQSAGFVEMCSQLIHSWDLTDLPADNPKSKIIATTPQGLSEVPIPVLALLVIGIAKNVNPQEASATN